MKSYSDLFRGQEHRRPRRREGMLPSPFKGKDAQQGSATNASKWQDKQDSGIGKDHGLNQKVETDNSRLNGTSN